MAAANWMCDGVEGLEAADLGADCDVVDEMHPHETFVLQGAQLELFQRAVTQRMLAIGRSHEDVAAQSNLPVDLARALDTADQLPALTRRQLRQLDLGLRWRPHTTELLVTGVIDVVGPELELAEGEDPLAVLPPDLKYDAMHETVTSALQGGLRGQPLEAVAHEVLCRLREDGVPIPIRPR